MEIKEKGLSAATLKHIAIVLMVFNHACSVIFQATGYDGLWLNAHWYITRAGFILFAFQIAEGMVKTHDRKRYLLRLAALAVLSEIPFDLCLRGCLFDLNRNNVFITLFLGAAAIALADRLGKHFGIGQFLVITLGVIIADLSYCDHGAVGYLVIVAFYFLRNRPVKMFVTVAVIIAIGQAMLEIPSLLTDFSGSLGCALLNIALELHGALAFPLIALYNGQKGKMLGKTFYYLFYPVHLLVLYDIAQYLL